MGLQVARKFIKAQIRLHDLSDHFTKYPDLLELLALLEEYENSQAL